MSIPFGIPDCKFINTCAYYQISANFLLQHQEGQVSVELLFSDSVMVTTFYFPVFYLTDLLSSLGGSLGLWLGLGILQLLQVVQTL